MSMAAVYILYSAQLQKFYTGSCRDVLERMEQHLSEFFAGAFTTAARDWVIYLHIGGLAYKQARKIENHIKRMKSKTFIENLKKYPPSPSCLCHTNLFSTCATFSGLICLFYRHEEIPGNNTI